MNNAVKSILGRCPIPLSTAALLALLALSLGWTYWITRPGAQTAAKPVSVWKLEAKDVRRLSLEEGVTKVTIEATPVAGAEQPYLWVQTHTGVQPPAAGRPAVAAATDEFKGGSSAWNLLKQLATLEVTRRVGSAENLKLADLGLAPPAGQLTLELQGDPAPYPLKLGAAPFGNVARYVQNARDGQVYLIGATPLRQLVSGTQLMDREWSSIAIPEARRLIVRQGARSVSLWRLDLPPAEPLRWARRQGAQAGEAAAQEFFAALVQLKVQSYRSAGKKLDPAQAELEVQVFRTAEAGPEGWLRLFRGDPQGAPGASSYTGRPVTFPATSAQQVVERGRALLSSR